MVSFTTLLIVSNKDNLEISQMELTDCMQLALVPSMSFLPKVLKVQTLTRNTITRSPLYKLHLLKTSKMSYKMFQKTRRD